MILDPCPYYVSKRGFGQVCAGSPHCRITRRTQSCSALHCGSEWGWQVHGLAASVPAHARYADSMPASPITVYPPSVLQQSESASRTLLVILAAFAFAIPLGQVFILCCLEFMLRNRTCCSPCRSSSAASSPMTQAMPCKKMAINGKIAHLDFAQSIFFEFGR